MHALLTSLECKEWSARNTAIRNVRCEKAIHAGRVGSIRDILFARQLYWRLLGKLCTDSLFVHEQPLLARMPIRCANVMSYTVFKENGLPGINNAFAAHVDGCSVGMVEEDTQQPIRKPWTFEVRNAPTLKAVLASVCCPGNGNHAGVTGKLRWQTAVYPPMLA